MADQPNEEDVSRKRSSLHAATEWDALFALIGKVRAEQKVTQSSLERIEPRVYEVERSVAFQRTVLIGLLALSGLGVGMALATLIVVLTRLP